MSSKSRKEVPLLGRKEIQAKVIDSILQQKWPQVMIVGGAKGIGKARMAGWIAQSLLCSNLSEQGPCLTCRDCELSGNLGHPDIIWYMPHPSMQDSNFEKLLHQLDEWRAAEIDRWREDSLAIRSDEGVGYYALTGRALRREVSKRPVMGQKRVVILIDIEKLAAAEGGANEAANSLLKSLEEPGTNNYYILTSSQTSRIPNTIRSRGAFLPLGILEAQAVKEILTAAEVVGEEAGEQRGRIDEKLLGGKTEIHALVSKWWQALTHKDEEMLINMARSQAAKSARGEFSSALVYFAEEIYQKSLEEKSVHPEVSKELWAHLIRIVELAYIQAQANGNPQLIIYNLLREGREALLVTTG